MSCTCQECSEKYKIDLLIPDEIWEKIKPEGKLPGAGLLCGSCIIKKIEKKYNYGSMYVKFYNL